MSPGTAALDILDICHPGSVTVSGLERHGTKVRHTPAKLRLTAWHWGRLRRSNIGLHCRASLAACTWTPLAPYKYKVGIS